MPPPVAATTGASLSGVVRTSANSIGFSGTQSEGTINLNNRAKAEGVGGTISCGVLNLATAQFTIPAADVVYNPFTVKLLGLLPLESTPVYEVSIAFPAAELPTLEQRYPDCGKALVRIRCTYQAGVDSLPELQRAALQLAEDPEDLLGGPLLDLVGDDFGRTPAQPLAKPPRGPAGQADRQCGQLRRSRYGTAREVAH